MEWIFGLIGVVIVVKWWKIFLPLGLVSGAILAGIFYWENFQAQERIDAEAKKKKELSLEINKARHNSTPKGKEWVAHLKPNPSTGEMFIRSGSILSDDGLCTLTVEERINGSRLSSLSCPKLELNAYEDIWVQFDGETQSRRMDVNEWSNKDYSEKTRSFYIPSIQSEYQTNTLSYNAFIQLLKTKKVVAIRIGLRDIDDLWFRFQLKGSTTVINHLGKPIDPKKDKMKSSGRDLFKAN